MSLSGLPVLLRLAGRPVILLGTGEAADAKRRLLERAGARVCDEDGEASLAIVAIEDDGEAEAAVARLRERGVLINATDRAALCDFTLPAIVDRDPVLIAIATGGASAGLAAALRQRLEALLPAGLGNLANGLKAARAAIRAKWPEAGPRRRAIGAALASGGPLDPLAEPAPDAVTAWLEASGDSSETRLVRVTLASPDPDELTLRTARLLAQADRVFHRADVPPAILNRARADAARHECAAAPREPGPGLSIDLEMAR
ncbi:precorrin-2 dehydrogenase/sirohydrochlorin ferrochelatase family protein [Stakelama tenebrarum]|uniref:precorrin-2 dehydrogenase n=1 Tax=Stakelama tenebrarum TaxID=2711215 RepID=A0A6G6Y1F7_9SPHN|nr:NAD(P)-dependent oxidoreductase [Sphingosinithalassobacter tenebrarum]QIG78740.1 siroheme synthase [Sphingosinithalassobacter tenebrarum]